MSIDVNVRSAE